AQPRPERAVREVPAHGVFPAAAAAQERAALRPVDGVRGQPRGAPLRLRVDEGLARGRRRLARPSPADLAARRRRLVTVRRAPIPPTDPLYPALALRSRAPRPS